MVCACVFDPSRMSSIPKSPQTALLSLARMAAACARLCHRAEILPVPDAAVAIALMEERLEAMVTDAGSDIEQHI